MYSAEIYNDQYDFAYMADHRTSDVSFPPAISMLFLALWGMLCLFGLGLIIVVKFYILGGIVIALPTFIGMVIRPTFALCVFMMVLPTGAGLSIPGILSLNRVIGTTLAISFLLNIIITRPTVTLKNKTLWLMAIYTIWLGFCSLSSPFLKIELIRFFAQIQLLALAFIIYLIITTNSLKTIRWILRSYVIGSAGANVLTMIFGMAQQSMQENLQGRLGATLGTDVNTNLLAGLTVMAFMAAVYLLTVERKKLKIFWLFCAIFLFAILLKIGSRAGMIALLFSMFSPLLFVRQITKKPWLCILLIIVLFLSSIVAGYAITSNKSSSGFAQRLTDIEYARQSLRYRQSLNRAALKQAISNPMGSTHYGWLVKASLLHFPHSDFFYLIGAFGFPAAALYVIIAIYLSLTVRKLPFGFEKLYVRAILIFFLIFGMGHVFVYKKVLWVFLGLALGLCDRFIAQLNENYYEYEEPDNLIATGNPGTIYENPVL